VMRAGGLFDTVVRLQYCRRIKALGPEKIILL
jgi:hypothetical protein